MNTHSVLLAAMIQVKKAAVLGAGTMGAQIAAHLANASVPTLLLDIVPKDESQAETRSSGGASEAETRPLGGASEAETRPLGRVQEPDHNAIARAGREAAKKAKPAAFFTADRAALVSIGNFDDDLAQLNDCDLIIEAVVENLEIKRSLYERVEQHRKPGAIVVSNTSGIPLKLLAEGRSDDFKAHFLGMHFFNPPRYMHLVELIRTEWTKPEVSCSMFGFLDERLGKGVVVAKDRPNFIANRIGTYGALVTMRTMLDDGYSFEEVDKITGPAAGRPKTATFCTFDLVGIDVFAHVVKNLHENLPDDPEREMFVMPELVTKMIERGMRGNKTKGGFYQRKKGNGAEARPSGRAQILVLDPATLEYRDTQKVKFPALDMAKNIEDTRERLKTLTWSKDRVGQFLWKTLSRTLTYTGDRIPEIADTIVEVDRAMRWGFNWELGPSEVWDAIGVEKSIAKLKEEGREVPANVQAMLDAGAQTFYKQEDGQRFYFDFVSSRYVPLSDPPGTIVLKSLKDRTGVIKKNSDRKSTR